NLPLWKKPIFAARVAAVWVFLAWERLQTARDVGGGNNFTMSGHESMGIDLDVAGLMRVCLAENDRRLSGYDPRLLRPNTAPRPSGLALHAQRGRMRIGSDAHRDAFCRQFTESYTEFDPERFPWPELDEAALQRLRAVPFWQEVLHTERRAGAIVEAFARGIEDPVVRAAVALQGREEARHASLLRVMIRRYGIDAVEQPLEALNPDTETAFIDFGYGECVDSFLGFGVFKIARQAGFLPEEMFKIFDTLMFEETRHIVFFVNWMAWREVRRGRGAGWQRALTSLRFYIRAAR